MHRLGVMSQLLLGVALLSAMATAAAAASCPLDLGNTAPRLLGTDLNGRQHELAQYQGKWVYIDFWATWCQPCMGKLPEVVDLQRAAAVREDIAVLSVSLDDEETGARIEDVAEDFGIDFPIIYDGEGWYGANAQEWCVDSIPATFLVDPQGRLVARDVDPSQVQQLVQRASQSGYQPIQVLTRERLLSDSPSTGRASLCDLQVAVDLHPDSSRIRRYKLQAYYAFREGAGTISAHTTGFEIELRASGEGTGIPYEMYIRPTEVDFNEREWRDTPIVAVASERPNTLPGLSATVNPGSRSCEFILPLPQQCVSIAYSLCFYDETLEKYICNGMRVMNNPL